MSGSSSRTRKQSHGSKKHGKKGDVGDANRTPTLPESPRTATSGSSDEESLTSSGGALHRGLSVSPRGRTRTASAGSVGFHRTTSFRPASPSLRYVPDNPFDEPAAYGGEEDSSDGTGTDSEFVHLTATSAKKQFTMRNVFLTLSGRLDKLERKLTDDAPRDRERHKDLKQEMSKMYGYLKRMGDALARISQGKRYDHNVQTAGFIELQPEEDEGDVYALRPYEDRGCGCFG